MSGLRAQLAAAGAVCRRDLALFASHRLRLATTFFTTAVSLTLFYYVSRLVRSPRIGSPDEYYAFVVVGIVVLSLVTATLATPVAILRQELLAGTFERMVLSPFGPVRCVVSLLIFPVCVALATAVAALLYASLAFGLDLRWETAPAAVPVALLAALSFAPFGLAMAAAVVVFKQTNAGAAFAVTGLTLVAGIYFPVALLPDWIRWASEAQPFTPAVDVLRNLIVGTPLRHPLGADLLKLAAFPAVTLPLALALLRGAVGRGRRLGTIIEY